MINPDSTLKASNAKPDQYELRPSVEECKEQNTSPMYAPPYSAVAPVVQNPGAAPSTASGGRLKWGMFGKRIGGIGKAEEEPIGALRQLGQALLVLVTAPLALLAGIFKMVGSLISSIGMIFVGLGNLIKAFVYQPGKSSERVVQSGPQQV